MNASQEVQGLCTAPVPLSTYGEAMVVGIGSFMQSLLSQIAVILSKRFTQPRHEKVQKGRCCRYFTSEAAPITITYLEPPTANLAQ